MSSTFGTLFRVSTWGESHGPSVGVVVDGCPPRMPITREELQVELKQLQKELVNCEELVRIPGAGHASNLSHPSEVNGPLAAFLRRHAG